MTVVNELEQPLGSFLQSIREEQGLSVQEVSERLKFTVRQVEALEAGSYGQLSGRTFVRGFVRGYARLLGLSDVDLLLQLEKELPEEAPPIHLPPLHDAVLPTGRRSYVWLKWLIVFVALLVIAVFAYRWLQLSHITRTPIPENQLLLESDLPPPIDPASAATSSVASTAGAASSSAVVASAPVASAQNSSAGLLIRLSGPSWIEVVDAQGKTAYAAIASEKEPVQLTNNPPLRVKIGKASAVSVFYAGQPIDLTPYTRGEVVRMTLPLAH